MSCWPTLELPNILSKKLSLPLHGTSHLLDFCYYLHSLSAYTKPNRLVLSPLAERGPLANQPRNCFVVLFISSCTMPPL
jgi:hypothetical protein